jgi:hypothetical protein
MSFEPTIFIRKSDLEKNRDTIEYGQVEYIRKKKFKGKKKTEEEDLIEQSFKHLEWALNSSTIKFPEIELVVVYVEFTSRNAAFRELLDDLKIEYQIDY